LCSLNYIAVSQDDNGLVNRYYKNVLYNPVRQKFDTLLKYKRYENSVNFGDSGGFQIANTEGSDEKRCIVKIGAGIQIKKNLTIIDPIDLCRQYGKLDIRYGFTLDHPFWNNSDSNNFSKRLDDSYSWAKLMFAGDAVRLISNMEHSSTIRKSTSSGFSSSLLNFPICHSSRR
jgi:hypothetical protein